MNNEQQKLPILVTGAAGRIGSVGRTVTELLLARGFRVRVQLRVDDERAAGLRRVEFDRSDLCKATRSCSIISVPGSTVTKRASGVSSGILVQLCDFRFSIQSLTQSNDAELEFQSRYAYPAAK